MQLLTAPNANQQEVYTSQQSQVVHSSLINDAFRVVCVIMNEQSISSVHCDTDALVINRGYQQLVYNFNKDKYLMNDYNGDVIQIEQQMNAITPICLLALKQDHCIQEYAKQDDLGERIFSSPSYKNEEAEGFYNMKVVNDERQIFSSGRMDVESEHSQTLNHQQILVNQTDSDKRVVRLAYPNNNQSQATKAYHINQLGNNGGVIDQNFVQRQQIGMEKQLNQDNKLQQREFESQLDSFSRGGGDISCLASVSHGATTGATSVSKLLSLRLKDQNKKFARAFSKQTTDHNAMNNTTAMLTGEIGTLHNTNHTITTKRVTAVRNQEGIKSRNSRAQMNTQESNQLLTFQISKSSIRQCDDNARIAPIKHQMGTGYLNGQNSQQIDESKRMIAQSSYPDDHQEIRSQQFYGSHGSQPHFAGSKGQTRNFLLFGQKLTLNEPGSSHRGNPMTLIRDGTQEVQSLQSAYNNAMYPPIPVGHENSHAINYIIEDNESQEQPTSQQNSTAKRRESSSSMESVQDQDCILTSEQNDIFPGPSSLRNIQSMLDRFPHQQSSICTIQKSNNQRLVNAESQFFQQEPASCQDEDDLRKICSNQMMTFGGSALKSVNSQKTPKWAQKTKTYENCHQNKQEPEGEDECSNQCLQQQQLEKAMGANQGDKPIVPLLCFSNIAKNRTNDKNEDHFVHQALAKNNNNLLAFSPPSIGKALQSLGLRQAIQRTLNPQQAFSIPLGIPKVLPGQDAIYKPTKAICFQSSPSQEHSSRALNYQDEEGYFPHRQQRFSTQHYARNISSGHQLRLGDNPCLSNEGDKHKSSSHLYQLEEFQGQDINRNDQFDDDQDFSDCEVVNETDPGYMPPSQYQRMIRNSGSGEQSPSFPTPQEASFPENYQAEALNNEYPDSARKEREESKFAGKNLCYHQISDKICGGIIDPSILQQSGFPNSAVMQMQIKNGQNKMDQPSQSSSILVTTEIPEEFETLYVDSTLPRDEEPAFTFQAFKKKQKNDVNQLINQMKEIVSPRKTLAELKGSRQ
ncbi:hypothetical protein FGO68_gene1436 [Halteria grandinella]|uniref:Uncharacterized protein n=1 Tax=Halteria grandinella TaxID=5974 RepID=A0A8J8T8I7_HALGN|nr:hypothetical protein FGO68_gene1436 [Halteria grandinella]